MSYKHITKEERLIIEHCYKKRLSVVEIVHIIKVSLGINRNRSSIYRELYRNGYKAYSKPLKDRKEKDMSKIYGWGVTTGYTTCKKYSRRGNKIILKYLASSANKRCQKRLVNARTIRAKMHKNRRLQAKVINLLVNDRLTPEMISMILKRLNRKSFYISYKSIYNYIHKHEKELKGLLPFLSKRKGRKKKYHTKRRTVNPDIIARSIETRKKSINNRKTYGHWEGDLIVGKGNSGYIATFNERKTRFLIAIKIESKTKEDFIKACNELVKNVGIDNIKTLTLDNGSEMQDYHGIERAIQGQVFYCHPNSPQERGTNEMLNGVIRRFIKKNESFKHLKQDKIDEIINMINNMPRKILKARTPKEVFMKHCRT